MNFWGFDSNLRGRQAGWCTLWLSSCKCTAALGKYISQRSRLSSWILNQSKCLWFLPVKNLSRVTFGTCKA